VRYRDPSTVEANRADCNGRSPHMRTRVPPAIVRGARSNSWRSRFARFVRARGWGLGVWGTGDATRPLDAPRVSTPGPGGRAAKEFLSEENEYGRFCRYGDHNNFDGRRSKARPNEAADPGANAKTRTVYYSLRPRWRARAGRCTGRPQGMPQGMPQGNGRTKSYSERACSIVLGMGAMFCMHGPAGDHGGWALVLVSFSSCSSSSTRP
jgi:hypothetical protein